MNFCSNFSSFSYACWKADSLLLFPPSISSTWQVAMLFETSSVKPLSKASLHLYHCVLTVSYTHLSDFQSLDDVRVFCGYPCFEYFTTIIFRVHDLCCPFQFLITGSIHLREFYLCDIIPEGRLQLDDCFILALICRIELYDLIR